MTAGDNREAFDCGRGSLNIWFARHAWRNQQFNASRTSIICDLENGKVAGFVSLCAGQIERAYLAKAARRNNPDPLPIVLLGQLAVDERYQGLGCANSLVGFALQTAVRLSADIGCFGVLTYPIDDSIRTFYNAFDFEYLPFDPARRMLVRIADLKHIGIRLN